MNVTERSNDVVEQTDERKALRHAMGKRIAQRREKLGWSQADLASRLGVTRTRIVRWETGTHEPQLEHLAALSQTLRTTLDELITGRKTAVAEELTAAQRKAGARCLNELAALLKLQSRKT